MKKSDIYDGFSKINEKYRSESGNFEDIAAEFRRAKIQSAAKFISLAASLVIAVVVSIDLHNKNNLSDRSSMLKPSGSDENNYTVSETFKSTENEQNITVSTSYTNIGTNENTEKIQTSTYKIKTVKPELISDKVTDFSAVNTVTEIKNYPVTKSSTAFSEASAVITGTSKQTAVTARPASSTAKPDSNTVKTSVTAVVTTAEKLPDTQKPSGSQVTALTEKPPVTALTTYTTPEENNDGANHGVSKTAAKPTVKPGLSAEKDTRHDNSYCFFEGGYYKALNRTVDVYLIGEYFGITDIYRYDADNGTSYQLKARVYKISDVPEYEMIAVLFDNETKFFAYGQS